MQTSSVKLSPSLPAEKNQALTRRAIIIVVLIGLLAALLHLAPYLFALWQLPDGWFFTGNLNTSPDLMQYYVWGRQTQIEGLVVSNKFTPEPNAPHLVLTLYYLIGQMAALSGLRPEFVYVLLGSVFAFGLIVLLFVIIRRFMNSLYQTWWMFALLLLGGGLGPLIKIISRYQVIQNNLLLKRTLVDGLWLSIQFEDLRGHFIFQTLFDTHFLLLWLLTAAAIYTLYLTFNSFSWGRLAMTAVLFFITTTVHLYEGITLVIIAAVVLFIFWRKQLLQRHMFLTFITGSIGVGISLVWQALLFRSSGLPITEWREVELLISAVFLAFPLAWIIIVWGLGRYWHNAGVKESFLLGWIAACLLIIFAAPFYPYPTRGTLTLQIPVFLVAGAIYFAKYERVKWWAAFIVLGTLLIAPLWIMENWWEVAQFNPNQPHKFMNEDHREIVDTLAKNGTAADILIAKEDQLLWLAPENPGKLYCGHFFLTVDYRAKCNQVENFYSNPAAAQSQFLEDQNIRFVFVTADDDPQQFSQLPGLNLLAENSTGTLFEFSD
ncbi:MAG: hypothetical protein GY796_31850 [Chloroflexi bacterium]|nr:hypothetical protein [Chloroflexota bacterium]